MKRLLTGIQPSGTLTLGNYIGAIKNFVKLQDEIDDLDFLIFIADLHAITVSQNKQELRKNIKSLAAFYIAAGLNPKKVHIFIQSEVKEHTELAYIMQCNGYIGELERMTQYKDKKKKQTESISVALLTYPSLMAADILLYDSDLVPVGEDQRQHLELTRDIGIRFNNKYGNTFKIPEGFIPKIGAKIMSLVDPSKKMSKSDDNPKATINVLDNINIIKNRIKSAITDMDGVVKYDLKNKPGISNLMTIYSSITNDSFKDIEKKYLNIGYAKFKEDLASIVANELTPLKEKYDELINSKKLDDILDEGREYASMLAIRKMKKVNEKIGLGRKIK